MTDTTSAPQRALVAVRVNARSVVPDLRPDALLQRMCVTCRMDTVGYSPEPGAWRHTVRVPWRFNCAHRGGRLRQFQQAAPPDGGLTFAFP